MKNIVFDIGGVIIARDSKWCSDELMSFWKIIHSSDVPQFWNDFDRGTINWQQTVSGIAKFLNLTYDECNNMLREAIHRSKPVEPTCQLITDLKAAGYKLYLLSNMSFYFFDEIRKNSVFSNFSGEVISYKYHTVKPEREIYEILLKEYSLDPADTFFIDDKIPNIEAAAELGIDGFVFDRQKPEDSCIELRKRLL